MAHTESPLIDSRAFGDSPAKVRAIENLALESQRTLNAIETHTDGHQVLLEKGRVLVNQHVEADGLAAIGPWDEWIGLPLGLGMEGGHAINADKALIHLELSYVIEWSGAGVKSSDVSFFFPLIGGPHPTPALDWAGASNHVREWRGGRLDGNDQIVFSLHAGDFWVDVKDNKLWHWKQYTNSAGDTVSVITFHMVVVGYRKGVR